MTPDEPRQLPPSFTPSTGRAARPSDGDAVITVGPQPGGGARPVPPAPSAVPPPPPARPASRVTRQSSQPVPVRPAPSRSGDGRGADGRPASFRPAGRPDAGGARQAVRPAPRNRPDGPDGPTGPGGAPAAAGPGGGGIRLRKGRIALVVGVLVLVLLLAWPIGLVMWANGKIDHVDALSGAAGTPGTTYLIAGSDSRADGVVKDGTSGARTDTIMLLQVPEHGTTSLISIPRDSYVAIPGHGHNKINAAYAFGGAPLLVKTVEKLTGMTVDHYVEVGFGGVEGIVDAVGGVRLCLDYDVNDKKSELKWKAGCHDVDGKTALAFSRMRYSDPTSDFGRTDRQRQLVDAIANQADHKSLLLQPSKQVSLIDATTGVLRVDDGTNIVGLGRLALAFRAANGSGGVTGLPPISDTDYRPGGVGSSVRLDPDATPGFFKSVMDGDLKPGKVNPIGK